MRKRSGESRGAHGEGLGSFKSRPRSEGNAPTTRVVGSGCSSARRGRFRAAREEGDAADTRGWAVSGCEREEGAAAGLAAALGRAVRKGEASWAAGGSWASRRKACGPK